MFARAIVMAAIMPMLGRPRLRTHTITTVPRPPDHPKRAETTRSADSRRRALSTDRTPCRDSTGRPGRTGRHGRPATPAGVRAALSEVTAMTGA
ncbi:hypothetical protein GCM10010495_51210 [Kitasatospora herbaricolor]|nr:hypothetical protein GCM10010495_51210 [Kitasatospora herbaricolor]